MSKQLREKLMRALLAPSYKEGEGWWSGLCMVDCHHLFKEKAWENCKYRQDCQQILVDQILAAIEEGIEVCKPCEGYGTINLFHQDTIGEKECPECGGKGWVMK